MNPSDSILTQGLEAECLEFIHRSGLKLTAPRRIILRSALSAQGVFDAEDLLAIARKEDGLISLTTVYRTLPILLKSGIIRRCHFDSEKHYYELNAVAKKKISLVCLEEESSIEIEDDCLWLRLQFLARQKGYLAKNIDVRIEAERADDATDRSLQSDSQGTEP